MALREYIHALMTDRRGEAGDRPAKAVLFILSLAYGVVTRAVCRLYTWGIFPSWRSPKPVISIGNITVGGTGKTPLVICVVRVLLVRQLRVAVLSRGYKSKPGEKSDEQRVLEESLPGVPVLIGPNRRKSIEEFVRNHAVDVFVCDDAFQHWSLKRNLDMVAVDAVNPFGNGHLVPRGILREPVSALKRAQFIVLTKIDHPNVSEEEMRQRVQIINPDACVAAARHGVAGYRDVFTRTPVDQSQLKGTTAVLMSGIAQPDAFRQSAEAAGLTVAGTFDFMDHHVYTAEDMEKVRRWALDRNIQTIVTTHKDAVKLQPFRAVWSGFRVYYLEVELEFTHGKNVVIDRILAAVRR